jgi:hypothetical protein
MTHVPGPADRLALPELFGPPNLLAVGPLQHWIYQISGPCGRVQRRMSCDEDTEAGGARVSPLTVSTK